MTTNLTQIRLINQSPTLLLVHNGRNHHKHDQFGTICPLCTMYFVHKGTIVRSYWTFAGLRPLCTSKSLGALRDRFPYPEIVTMMSEWNYFDSGLDAPSPRDRLVSLIRVRWCSGCYVAQSTQVASARGVHLYGAF